MDTLKIVAVVAIVAYIIGRQFVGEPLRAKRVVVLPAILTVVGFVSLGSPRLSPADLACLVISGVVSAAIGLGQGRLMRLYPRDGHLWGRMPLVALWLWAALIVARFGMALLASGLDARVAASTAPLALLLGVNRLAQAAVLVPRAMATGVPFAPEKDGRSFMSTGDR
ncbi:hypothetical protein GCM10029964_098310 [Kibdelosporangium lantanae]